MTTPITSEIMQAAERLRRGDHDGKGETSAAMRDLIAMTQFALSILPKGERPVPICSYDATEGQTLWNNDDETGEQYSGLVISAGPDYGNMLGIQWDNSIGFGDEGYPTEEAANLARRWQLLDALTGDVGT